MFTGFLKFFGAISIFILIGALVHAPIWLALTVGTLLGSALAFHGWWRRKTRIVARRQISAEPFNGTLPPELGFATITAIALEGDETYSVRAQLCGQHLSNFDGLRVYANTTDGTMLELQAALVVEAANKEIPTAVAVTAGGFVLGYLPAEYSQSLFPFLMDYDGIARVNANIYIEVAAENCRVELDLVRPYRIVRGV
jgi:hypothetical protein